jgi:hypothetical protein
MSRSISAHLNMFGNIQMFRLSRAVAVCPGGGLKCLVQIVFEKRCAPFDRISSTLAVTQE